MSDTNTPAPAPEAPAPAVEQGMTDDAAFASLGMADAAAPAQVDQPEPGAQVPATAEPEAKTWDGRDAATALLSSYGHVPKSVLEVTPDAVLQQWSAEYQASETKTKTEIQRRSEEVKQLRDELGRFTPTGKPETATKAEPTRPTAAADLDAELKPLVDELRELGVPAGEKLASLLKRHVASSSAEVEGLRSVNGQLAGEIGEFFVDQARSQLAAQYPQLSDDSIFEKVREEANIQLKTGRYEGIPFRKAIASAMATATKLTLFEDIVKAGVEKVQSNSRERLAGQPTAPTRQPAPKPMTPEERDDRIADLLIAGKAEEAQRLARG
jgi:hypothetical protein